MADPVRVEIARILDANGSAIDAAIVAAHDLNERAASSKHNRNRAIASGGYGHLLNGFDAINEIWRLKGLEEALPANKKHLLRPMFDALEEAAQRGQSGGEFQAMWRDAYIKASARSRP